MLVLFYMEVWKNIKDYENCYQISNLGNVKSLSRFVDNHSGFKKSLKEKLLKNHISKTGYFVIDLKKENQRKTFKVHRLIALAFIDNKNNLPFINHIDGNKLNNNISNLEWVSNRENCCHAKSILKKSSIYTGVCFRKNRNKWQSSIIFNGKQIYLGTFENEIDAYKERINFELKNNIINRYL